MKIQRIHPQKIRLRGSLMGTVVSAVFTIPLLLFISLILWLFVPDVLADPHPSRLVFAGLFALVWVAAARQLLGMILHGRGEVLLDGSKRLVYKDGKALTAFAAVDKVRIRRVFDDEASDDYMLYLDRRDGRSEFIWRSSEGSQDVLYQVADEIADLLDVPVVRVG